MRWILLGLLFMDGCAVKRTAVVCEPNRTYATKDDLRSWFSPIYAYDFATGASVAELKKEIEDLKNLMRKRK